MKESIHLREVAVYHPELAVDNQMYIEHFNKKGQCIDSLLESLGRENRYVADYESETTLTMAVEATKRVLEKAQLLGEDLDMIVFVSGTPEYFWPPNAVAIHHAIQGNIKAIVYDINVACVGMVVAVEQVSRSMMNNPNIKRALVVGSEQMHRYARPEEAVTYANFGDGASAVILEKSEGEGFVDSAFHVNTESIEKIKLPACGVSKLYHPETTTFEKQIQWNNVNNENAFLSTVNLINELLEKQQLSPDDIKSYCFSQLSRNNLYKVQETLNQDIDKFPIVGTLYGYTGSASPFMAFDYAVNTGQLKRGDYVIFWSVGAGTTACAMLFKY